MTKRKRPEKVCDKIKTQADVEKCVRAGENAKYSAGRSLYLTVRGGSVLWEYAYKQNRKLHTKVLGSAHDLTLQQAEAERFEAWKANQPKRSNLSAAAVQQTRISNRVVYQPVSAQQPPTIVSDKPAKSFAEAAEAYLVKCGGHRGGEHAAEWSEDTERKHRRRLQAFASELNDKPVKSITVDDVAAVLEPIWSGPRTDHRGGKLRSLLENIFSANKVWPNPASWTDLKHVLSRKAPKVQSHASLPWRQVPALMAKLDLDDDRKRALRFLILTGVRHQEAAGARWEEIDRKARLWRIPAERMKMDEAHTVPLSDAAMACLGKPGRGLVFGRLHCHSLMRLLTPFGLTDAANEPVTVHGFRTSLATWAQDHKYRTEVIDRVLAHTERNKARKAYLRSDPLDDRRALLREWGKYATRQAA